MALEGDWTRDGKTHDSGSAMSGRSSLDDDTDEFGRRIFHHARDERRLGAALNRPPQAFSKARRNPRITAALAQLDDPLDVRSIGSGGSDPGVADHSLTDTYPPLNIPRGWGRKAKHNNMWLRRSGTDDQENERPSSDPLEPQVDAAVGRTGRADWTNLADRPVQSIETGLPQTRNNRGAFSADTAFYADDHIDRIRQLEVEHDSVAQGARRSNDHARRQVDYRQDLGGVQRPQTTAAKANRAPERETGISIKHRLEARLAKFSGHPVPRHRRQSLDDPEDADLQGFKTDLTKNSPQASRDHGFSRATGVSRNTLFDPPAVRQSSAQAPEVVPDIFVDGQTSLLETPHPSTILEGRTPQVMGAWVDTPLPAKRESLEKRKHFKTESEPAVELPTRLSPSMPLPETVISAPSPPRAASALHGLLHPSTRTSPKKDLNVGDDTLASLEGLLDPTATLTELSAALDMDSLNAELRQLQSSGKVLNKQETQRRDELFVLKTMAQAFTPPRKGASGAIKTEERAASVASKHNNSATENKVCEACQRGVLSAAASEFKELFVRRKAGPRRNKWWIRRLTWLGAFLFWGFVWIVSEFWLCGIYCKPLYAYEMEDYGEYPGAPRMPFVIPTVLFRAVEWYIYPLTWLFWLVFSPLYDLAMEYWDYDEGDWVWNVDPYLYTIKYNHNYPHLYRDWRLDLPTSKAAAQATRSPEESDTHTYPDGHADEDDDDSPAGIARLWSWFASPAESAAEAVKQQAAMAEDEFWASNPGSGEKVEDEDVTIVDTRGMWD